MKKFMKCTCGKVFKDGAALGKHRSRCVEFQKKKYYTKASLEQVKKLIESLKG